MSFVCQSLIDVLLLSNPVMLDRFITAPKCTCHRNGVYYKCISLFHKLRLNYSESVMLWIYKKCNISAVIIRPHTDNAILLLLADCMMTSSNGSIFRETGPLCEEFTGHRLIPLAKASGAELDVFFDLHLNKRLRKHWRRRWFEKPSCLLWRHCSGPAELL